MDIFEFVEKLEGYIREEEQAAADYRALAADAATIGLSYTVSDKLISISLDESSHYYYLKELCEKLKPLPKPRVEHRFFPKTYGDWVNLAEDIKASYPDDPITRAWINKALQHIADEDELADESKRYLVEKAGELGIR